MKSYLISLWEHSKSAFMLIMVFVFFQLILTVKGIEITPWFHWGMYSQPKTDKKQYTIYRIKLDGEFLDLTKFNDLERECIYSPLKFYSYLLENNFQEPWESYYMEKIGGLTDRFTIDKTVQPKFQTWYRQRISEYLDQEVKTIEIYKVRYSYRDGQVTQDHVQFIQEF